MTVLTESVRRLDMDTMKVFIAATLAFIADYLFWVPEAVKIIILIATAVYVVFRMMREIRRYFAGDDHSGGT